VIRNKILSGLILSLLAADVSVEPTSAQEQAPSTTAPTDTRPLRNLGRMDVRHPLHVGSNYYPKQSLRNHEQGKCTLAFFIEADGPALNASWGQCYAAVVRRVVPFGCPYTRSP